MSVFLACVCVCLCVEPKTKHFHIHNVFVLKSTIIDMGKVLQIIPVKFEMKGV